RIPATSMTVEQIAIFIENRSGRLAEVAGILAQEAINIRAIFVADTTDFGILRLIVDRPEQAMRALKENGFTVSTTPVVAIEMPDRPGGLWEILKRLESVGLNVEYMYAVITRSGNNAVVVFRFDDPDRAVRLLREAGIGVLSGADVYGL
ncbi:MAG: ACT domain-containing protein, partial [Candidatus Methylomirabilota bacterium]